MKTESEILEVNKKQKEYYNQFKMNTITRIWTKIREGLVANIRKDIGMSSQVYDLHKVWFGDLSNKRILDLGCYAGNALSLYMAERAKEYVGIDLSDVAIDRLSDRLKDIPTAKAMAVDFLSEEQFSDTNFDLIYAYGVLHHFENLDVLINQLNNKLSPTGEIISYDPLETSLPVKVMRIMYRPFQSDAAWEWPFTQKTVQKISNSFNVIERRGLLGKTKWVFLLNFLPLSSVKKMNIGKKWHKSDWDGSSSSDPILFSCMHLTMHLRKK